jgi:hypothetical protein
MKISPCATPGIILCLIICLLLASGCISLSGGNSSAHPLITDVPTTVSPAPPAAAPGGACAEGQTTCGGACRNTLVDSSNCGRCGNTCSASQYCNSGVCTAGTMAIPATSLTTGTPAPGTSCASGQTLCSGVCRNTQADTSNCGTCGHVCGSGQTCNNGVCTGSAPSGTTTTNVACTAGLTNCGGTCVSLRSPANCGSCGAVCPMAQDCYSTLNPDGTIVDAHCDCIVSGTTKCSGSCVVLSSSPYNCGSCGNVCGSGQTCNSGVCTGSSSLSCGPGLMNCGGTCVNRHDDSNCGSCGNACGSGKQCFWSTAGDGTLTDIHCDCIAGSGRTLCSASCLNLQSDDSNCGSCGNVCTAGQYCNSGRCVGLPVVVTTTASPSCAKGLTSCSGGKSGSVCTDLNTDNYNCGYCGHVCTTGSCSGGTCGYVLK